MPGGTSQVVWAFISRYSRDASGAITVGATLGESPSLGAGGSSGPAIAAGVAGGVVGLVALGLLHKWMRARSASGKTHRSTEMSLAHPPA